MSSSSQFLINKDKAIRHYDAAFHLLKVTFPVAKDPKLLIAVIDNIASSFNYSMDAILAYERELKLIPNYLDNFQSKFNLFRLKSVRRNKVPNSVVYLMQELKEMLELHKKSPMEFQRGNRFVICTKDYQMKIISVNKIKEYLDLNKEMLTVVDHVINRY